MAHILPVIVNFSQVYIFMVSQMGILDCTCLYSLGYIGFDKAFLHFERCVLLEIDIFRMALSLCLICTMYIVVS